MFLTKRSYLLVGGAVVLAAALVTGAAVHADRPVSMTVPEHTPIHITLDQAVSSDQNISGDHFQATVTEPVDVNGKTVIPQGAHVEGLIVDARKSGRLMGRAQLRMVLDAVQVDGKTYDLRTGAALRTGGNHKKRNFAWIGGGAAGGALFKRHDIWELWREKWDEERFSSQKPLGGAAVLAALGITTKVQGKSKRRVPRKAATTRSTPEKRVGALQLSTVV
jgi:hypothetical protein